MRKNIPHKMLTRMKKKYIQQEEKQESYMLLGYIQERIKDVYKQAIITNEIDKKELTDIVDYCKLYELLK